LRWRRAGFRHSRHLLIMGMGWQGMDVGPVRWVFAPLRSEVSGSFMIERPVSWRGAMPPVITSWAR
jgi:hypothetical protein